MKKGNRSGFSVVASPFLWVHPSYLRFDKLFRREMGETTVSDLQLFLARGNELARHLCALLVCTEFAFLMFAQAAHSSGSDSAETLFSHTGEILEKRVCEITRKHSTGDNTETYECELPRTDQLYQVSWQRKRSLSDAFGPTRTLL